MKESNIPQENQNVSNNKKGPFLDSKYILQKELGSGLTSKVFKVLDVQQGEIKAAKIFESNATQIFRKELNILNKISAINSPLNIKFYEGGFGPLKFEGKNGTDNEEEKMYIILEYGTHGNLYDYISNTKQGFNEDICQYIFYKLLQAVDALHRNGICHRDLKPENILLSNDYELKLCDFGFSASFIKNEERKKLFKPLGTHYYCAPEILENNPYDGDKVDIFSMGALLFTLMTKKFGFYEAKVNNISRKPAKILYNYIKNKVYDKYWDLIENTFNVGNLSQNFKNLFVKLVAYKPEERPTIDEIKNDEWLRKIRMADEEQLNIIKNNMIKEFQSITA